MTGTTITQRDSADDAGMPGMLVVVSLALATMLGILNGIALSVPG